MGYLFLFCYYYELLSYYYFNFFYFELFIFILLLLYIMELFIIFTDLMVVNGVFSWN